MGRSANSWLPAVSTGRFPHTHESRGCRLRWSPPGRGAALHAVPIPKCLPRPPRWSSAGDALGHSHVRVWRAPPWAEETRAFLNTCPSIGVWGTGVKARGPGQSCPPSGVTCTRPHAAVSSAGGRGDSDRKCLPPAAPSATAGKAEAMTAAACSLRWGQGTKCTPLLPPTCEGVS